MRAFDFAPFYRSTVGFDRLFSMLDQAGGAEGTAVPGYPPYNIERSGENAYNISVAVAGFADADLSIEVKENTLTIRGNKQANGEEKTTSGDMVYQGIAERNFERNFQLADHVQVKGAGLENGLLRIDLVRVLPEAMKARAIPITTASKVLVGEAVKIAA
jgi:molecular chaperone IbpA